MLKTMRHNTKSIIWLVIIIFVGGTAISTLSTRHNKSTVGRVFGKKISQQTYKTFYDIVFYSPRFQNLIQTNANLPETFLSNTTMQYIALHAEAKKRRIKATDADVRNEIKRRYSIDGVFNPRLYEMHVHNVMRKKPRAFEESIRKEIMINKLIDSLKTDITVTDDEAREAFNLEKSELSIIYTTFTAQSYETLITVDESILESYYAENKNTFTIPEKYNFTYLAFPHENYTQDITVSEIEAEAFFEKNERQFIDPETGKPRPFDTVKEQIREQLKGQKARAIAFEEADDIQRGIKETKNFESGAQKAQQQPRRTGFKTSEELMNIFGWTPDFYNRLDSMSPNSLKTIQTNTTTYVLLLTEKEYAYTPVFSDITGKVRTQYIQAKSQEYAAETAQEHYDALQNTTQSFEDYASQHELSTVHFGPLSGETMTTTPLGSSYQLLNTLRDYSAGTTAPPYAFTDGYALIHVAEVSTPPAETFEEEKAALKERLLSIKANQVVTRRIGEILKNANIKNNMAAEDDPFADIQ